MVARFLYTDVEHVLVKAVPLVASIERALVARPDPAPLGDPA